MSKKIIWAAAAILVLLAVLLGIIFPQPAHGDAMATRPEVPKATATARL